jgi:hypothetical protein
MTVKSLIVDAGKILLGGLVFALGTVLGGMLASLLNLPLPSPVQGVDMSQAAYYTMLATPLVALALALLAGGLGGSFIARAVTLALFTWIAYTVNTQLEASIFSEFAKGIPFALISYAVPAALCGVCIAWLFPSDTGTNTREALNAYWSVRSAPDWAWRLALGALAFMPIYFAFGLMVVPFTGEYYRQNLFGLAMPTLEQILPILFVRSLLFFAACLPILVLWQKSRVDLFWRLGLALYLLVGLIYMLTGTWLPWAVRMPHALEILADEFVYAGVLIWLLARKQPAALKSSQTLDWAGTG